MKQFKTIGKPKTITSVMAHIDLTMDDWKSIEQSGHGGYFRYEELLKREVPKQLGWNGAFTCDSAFHYLTNNRGVRLTIRYEYEEEAA